MNNPAIFVHVVEPKQYLLRDLLDEVHRDTFVFVATDQTEKVLA